MSNDPTAIDAESGWFTGLWFYRALTLSHQLVTRTR